MKKLRDEYDQLARDFLNVQKEKTGLEEKLQEELGKHEKERAKWAELEGKVEQ